jgi:hypothetical protein
VSSDAFFLTSEGERVSLHDGATIGRLTNQDITFDVAAMSRAHAAVHLRSGSWWIQDLSSKNGTFVNGHPVNEEPLGLSDGDTVVFAGAVTVLFHDPAVTPIAPRIGRLSGVWIDPATEAVWVDATRLEPPLSARQLLLLRLLDDNVGEVVTRSQIVAKVWADAAASGVSDEAVTALVKRLRSRLRESPIDVDHLEVVKGRGIRLNRPE